ncbi:hypothetical protein E2C01_067784 [Portunus trituberculatus]|uniref:Uncharacterized protein n=1 Tax=Portunus trituberculatus TaxID=210409 RepID=A0A5B7HUJ9_PORTR|nr:hypothetical protein [Portunus trituberculatus]
MEKNEEGEREGKGRKVRVGRMLGMDGGGGRGGWIRERESENAGVSPQARRCGGRRAQPYSARDFSPSGPRWARVAPPRRPSREQTVLGSGERT